VVWEDERNERYLVKSIYNLAMKCIIWSDTHHVAGNRDDICKTK
jgi:hypothetical protein